MVNSQLYLLYQFHNAIIGSISTTNVGDSAKARCCNGSRFFLLFVLFLRGRISLNRDYDYYCQVLIHHVTSDLLQSLLKI